MQTGSADPDQMPHNAGFDQGLHCLLADCSIKTLKEVKRKTQKPLK